MSAIADNITNVNTVGYKRTNTDFLSLVTKQTVGGSHAAAGVQARSVNLVDVQGLLQSTTSQTDLAISGDGFFLVNESSIPGAGDQFLFTRAGSFSRNADGNLVNTGGFYLQGWPTDASGNIVLPPSSTAVLPNQNMISTDFLETVNLNRVGGTATETSQIAIGANLPSTDTLGASHSLDVQLFNSLGNTSGVNFEFSKLGANQWDLNVAPPSGAAVATLYDSNGTDVYRSVGQLEFTGDPATWVPATTRVAINGTTYTYGTASWPSAGVITVADAVANLIASVQATDPEFAAGAGNHTIAASANDPNTIVITGGTVAGAPPDITVDLTNLIDTAGDPVTRQGQAPSIIAAGNSFTVYQKTVAGAAVAFNAEGVPSSFGVAEMAIVGFADGAGDMNNTDIDSDSLVDITRIALDFGTVGVADGLTQFGGNFSPTFTQQDGAQFGTYSGLSINDDGLVTAVFDNGQMRPIYRLPIATFVNPNGLEAQTGNVFRATAESGNALLRHANSGAAGAIEQSSVEASTVDIGEEFTSMIVVQRAYSAATRIITAADEMLEELIRVKR
jgi:flagellar hook protein FlgE